MQFFPKKALAVAIAASLYASTSNALPFSESLDPFINDQDLGSTETQRVIEVFETDQSINIVNRANGSLTAEFNAVYLHDMSSDFSILNEGIIQSGTPEDPTFVNIAIDLSGNFSGDLNNTDTGTIGGYSYAILGGAGLSLAGKSYDTQSIWDGSIDNSGTIYGSNFGIILEEDSELTGQINNSGLIEGGSDRSVLSLAIINDGKISKGIINTGTISGRDASIGNFDYGYISTISNDGTLNGGIYNSGTIDSISNSGVIAGGFAIQNGGMITSDISNNGSINTTTGIQIGYIIPPIVVEVVEPISSTDQILPDLNAGDGDGFVDLIGSDIEPQEMAGQVQGNLINTGSINTTEAAISVTENSVITGQIINSGTLSSSGEQVDTISIVGQTGNIINNGSILSENGQGINSYGASNHDTINNGVISAPNDVAITLTHLSGSNITNNGEIVGLSGIFAGYLDESSGTITNTGTITSQSTAVLLFGVNGQVVNSGLISSEDMLPTVFLEFRDGKSVINSGSIINNAGGTAVAFNYLEVGGESSSLLEQRSGLIRGNIDASNSNNDQLLFSGGAIEGNIVGVESITVDGNVSLQGDIVYEGDEGSLLTIADTGNLNLSQPTLVAANLVQEGQITLLPNNPEQEALIQVSGYAALGNNARISLTPTSYQELSYSVLEADGGLDIFSNDNILESDSILFSAIQTISDNQLSVQFIPNDVEQDILAAGANSNIAAFAGTLQNVLSQVDQELQKTVIAQLNTVQAADELVELINNTIPGLDNETQTALLAAANAVQDGAFSNILSHLSDLRNSGSGVGTGDLPYSGGVWVKALHTEADQGEQRDGGTIYNGYKARSKGFTLGGDIELSPEWTVGTAFSFADVTVNVKDSGNNTTMDSYQLSLYGDWQRNNWFANGILNLGYNNVDSKRYAGSTRYEADYGSKQFGVNVTGGYQFWFNDKDTLIEPQLALNYSLLDTNSYKETSQSGDVVEVSPHNQEVIELGAGVRLSQLIETDRGPLLPEARLFAYHDFKADKVTQNVTAKAFNLPLSFRTVGIEPEKTRYQAGLGVSYWMDNNFSLSLNYDHTWQSDFKADSVQAKVRYDF